MQVSALLFRDMYFAGEFNLLKLRTFMRQGAKLRNANLKGANLQRAYLRHVNLRDTVSKIDQTFRSCEFCVSIIMY